MATVALIGDMALLGFDSETITSAIIIFTCAVRMLVLEVISDIDDPFGGAWGVTPAPLERIKFAAWLGVPISGSQRDFGLGRMPSAGATAS